MIELPDRLSYSSLSSYSECGERWKLERGYHKDSSTWFATVAGSAVHEISEYIDLKEIGLFEGEIPSFLEVFDRLLAQESERGIEVKPSGRVLNSIGKTGGPNKKDRGWYIHYGPLWVEAWIEWKATNGDLTLATMPNGSPGIEVEINQQAGGEPHKGFIDRVYVRASDGEYVIVDLKTGKEPAGNIQLGSYSVGLLREHGIEANLGAYWMTDKGELTAIVDLTVYSASYIDSLYEMAWRGIRAGVFLPNVTNLCRGCGVREYCRAVGGRSAITIPVRDTLVERKEVPQSAAV